MGFQANDVIKGETGHFSNRVSSFIRSDVLASDSQDANGL